MKPLVSIIMGSTSDLPIMEKACKLLDEMQVPFEVNALSAHRTPDAVEEFARTAKDRGIKVIIAGAGMAAALIVHEAGVPVAVLGLTLRAPVGPDAKFGVLEPFGALPCTERAPVSLIGSGLDFHIRRLCTGSPCECSQQ